MEKRHRVYQPMALALGGMLLLSACNTTSLSSTAQKAKELLDPAGLISSQKKYGHLGQETLTVPAAASIFLADAPEDTVLEYPPDSLRDTVPANAPIKALKDLIHGGETLDVYATGQARHVPQPSVSFGPKGWVASIEAGPARNIHPLQGRIGCLVGLFDNQNEPFVIGQRKQIQVPRGARCLYLGLLDYPGASSNNQGEYLVTIDIIRR